MAARRIPLALIPAILAITLASPAQQQPSSSTYIDLPLAQLQRQIPALAGLHPAQDDLNLPLILSAIADSIATQVPKLPNIIAREEVYRTQRRSGQQAPDKMIAVSRNQGAGIVLAPEDARGEEFRYILLCHHTEKAISVEESRTDPSGHPVNLVRAAGSPLGSGFAYQWLLFSSANQFEFNFRYLGRQTIEGRETDVIAFAQLPERVRSPAVFTWQDKQASYYYQGVLWADADTGQIVLLHTDLLWPLPKMQLRGLTTELHFGPIRLPGFDPGLNGDLWLPQAVHLTITQDRYDIDELHQYSDYHLYHSQATIVPAQ